MFPVDHIENTQRCPIAAHEVIHVLAINAMNL
jgi:hypothetical protein